MPRFRLLQTSLKGRKGPGTNDENQDRVFHRRLRRDGRELALFGIADGISRCPDGGAVAAYAIDQHLARARIFHREDAPPAVQLRAYLEALNARFYAEFASDLAMLESGATLSVGLLDGPAAHCFWVGDSPIFLARKKGERFKVSQLSIPDCCGRLLTDCFGAESPFHLKHRQVALRAGDALIIASDGGIRDAPMLAALLDAHGLTRRLLRAVEEKASSAEYFDDASIVLAELAA